jgi:hypothetical protein
MGLLIRSGDRQQDIWAGAYSAFLRWRAEVGRVLGATEYHKGKGGWQFPQVINQDNAISAFESMLESMKRVNNPSDAEIKELKTIEQQDPALYNFLVHSDCDGEWSPLECKEIAQLLQKALPKLPKTKDLGHIGDWTKTTEKFIHGLLYCAKQGVKAEFV